MVLDDPAQADFNAARIYAQAIEYAAREVDSEGAGTVARYRAYRARSLELLDRTLRRISDPVRRREILNDPALKPLRLAPGRSPPPRLSSLATERSSG